MAAAMEARTARASGNCVVMPAAVATSASTASLAGIAGARSRGPCLQPAAVVGVVASFSTHAAPADDVGGRGEGRLQDPAR